jgi:hypothetical protein
MNRIIIDSPGLVNWGRFVSQPREPFLDSRREGGDAYTMVATTRPSGPTAETRVLVRTWVESDDLTLPLFGQWFLCQYVRPGVVNRLSYTLADGRLRDGAGRIAAPSYSVGAASVYSWLQTWPANSTVPSRAISVTNTLSRETATSVAQKAWVLSTARGGGIRSLWVEPPVDGRVPQQPAWPADDNSIQQIIVRNGDGSSALTIDLV